jgi:hypothetical protein
MLRKSVLAAMDIGGSLTAGAVTTAFTWGASAALVGGAGTGFLTAVWRVLDGRRAVGGEVADAAAGVLGAAAAAGGGGDAWGFSFDPNA